MNQQKIADLTVDLIMRYYENDVMPFLNHMDDDALWYGPAKGQFLRGRETMIEAWSKEENQLTFTVGNMKVLHASGQPSTCEVMLTYTVVTHYPDGHDLSIFQRIQLSWVTRTLKSSDGTIAKVPRILMCHISNPHAKHENDTIYAKNFHQVYAGIQAMPLKGERLHLPGADKADYFLMSDSILWIETAYDGKHCKVHLNNEAIEIRLPVSEMARRYEHLFKRCHASYLVNPNYIRSIRRFKVTMTDGTELSIPEKKYTAFRDSIVNKH